MIIPGLPGLAASIIILWYFFSGHLLDWNSALALSIELGLLALGYAICWLGMSAAARNTRRQAAHLRAILNKVSDGVLTLDMQGHFVSANPALLKMIPEDHLRQINATPLEETIRWRQTVFSVTSVDVPEVGSVLIFRDETRHHETERAKDALLATVSHELRTPLGVVMNYLELMLMLSQKGKIDPAQFSEYLLRSLESSRRLTRLVNDIIDQAQFEAGMIKINEQVFNLHTFLENTLAMVDLQVKEKHLSSSLIIAPYVPLEIFGDPIQLRKVLLNLLDNAIKFTKQGEIKIQTSLCNKQTLCISIIDSGSGILPAQLPDVFKPFLRASNYAAREHRGIGLGLSITQQIVVRMGGEISVLSTPGVGSAFIISLPLKSFET